MKNVKNNKIKEAADDKERTIENEMPSCAESQRGERRAKEIVLLGDDSDQIKFT